MIVFKEEDHSYKNKDKKYQSVTTLIGKYKQPFDAIAISKAYAKKHPEKTAAQWRKEWERIKDEACEKGTNYHNKQEQKTIDKQWITVGNNTTLPVIAPDRGDGTSYSRNLKELEDGAYPELILYDHEFNLAGQSDITLIETDPSGIRYVDIDDYKTNKEIKEESYFNHRTQEYKMMLAPLDDLMDCNYIHYCLQISTYAYILERQGYVVRNTQFRHCIVNADGTEVHRIYPVDYNKYKQYIKRILK